MKCELAGCWNPATYGSRYCADHYQLRVEENAATAEDDSLDPLAAAKAAESIMDIGDANGTPDSTLLSDPDPSSGFDPGGGESGGGGAGGDF